MKRRVLAILLLLIAIMLAVLSPVVAFTPMGPQMLEAMGLATPEPSPILATPTPTPPPKPVLTVQGPLPVIAGTSAYLVDMDTGHILADINAHKTVPMASTTKIMTALIAIQSGNLDQAVTIKQDALNQVLKFNGSSAYLRVGDRIALRDLIYGLMLPSGDDAAVAIADTLAGSPANFVQRMNLFAYRLRLFQTHYTNPDGLTPDGETNPNHYTTAVDLVRLSSYAMSVPLFAQIVQTKTYTVPATDQHTRYVWTNTNKLLVSYSGMLGIKTGHTQEAGYCLVFSAMRNDHHLIGVVLNSSSEEQRNRDAQTLLDWGFSLPLLPPTE